MKYIFSEEEFAVLLSVSGLTGFYSFDLPKDIRDTALIESLHALYQKDWIRLVENRFVPQPDLAKMVQAMGNSKYVLKTELFHHEYSQCLLYPYDRRFMVILERCPASDSHTIKLRISEPRSFLFDLIANELPAFSTPPLYSPENSMNFEMAEREGNIIFQMERICLNNPEEKEILSVRSTSAFCWILMERNKEKDCSFYSNKRFEKQFYIMIRREEHD